MIRVSFDAGSINFVDENNKVLGYGFELVCCEEFGYEILDADKTVIKSVADFCFNDNLKGYIVVNEDPRINIVDNVITIAGNFDGPPSEVKTCVYGEDDDYFAIFDIDCGLKLKIYNYHNGYYSHGFGFSDGSEIIFEGEL